MARACAAFFCRSMPQIFCVFSHRIRARSCRFSVIPTATASGGLVCVGEWFPPVPMGATAAPCAHTRATVVAQGGSAGPRRLLCTTSHACIVSACVHRVCMPVARVHASYLHRGCMHACTVFLPARCIFFRCARRFVHHQAGMLLDCMRATCPHACCVLACTLDFLSMCRPFLGSVRRRTYLAAPVAVALLGGQ